MSKISLLASASALTGTETLPVVQGGVTKKTTVADIAAEVDVSGKADLTGATFTGDVNITKSGDTLATLTSTSASASLVDFYNSTTSWRGYVGYSASRSGFYLESAGDLFLRGAGNVTVKPNGSTTVANFSSSGLQVTGSLTVNGSAVGGGAPTHFLKSVSATYYGPGTPTTYVYNSSVAGWAPASTTLVYAFPFMVGDSLTTDRIGCSVVAIGGSGMKIGIYSAHATTKYPETLIDSGTASSAMSGGTTYVTNAVSLSANTLYWIAAIFQSTGGGIQMAEPVFSLGNNNVDIYSGVTCSGQTYAGGLPSTFGTPSLVSISASAGSATQRGVPNFYVRAA